MSQKDPLVYIEDIADEARRALDFVEGLSVEEFRKDIKTIYAVVRALEIIGEASKRVTPEIRDNFPGVSWRLMARMRDKLIHHYAGMNVNVVWNTVQNDLPPLLEQMQQIKKDLEHS